MSYLKTLGIVIREVNTGEADKIVTVFSRDCGRITAFAKGARRSKSKYSAGTQLMSYCEFVLFIGKDMYSVNSCDVIEPFYDIRNDIERLTYAAHFLDLANDMVQENQASPNLLKLLLNSLHLLAKTDKSPELIARIFELKSLSIMGYAPYVKGCIICGRDDCDSYEFSFRKCGFICSHEECMKEDIYAQPLSAGTSKAIQHIVYSAMDSLFSFTLSPQALLELGIINRRYLRERLERDYNKLDFLKSLQS